MFLSTGFLLVTSSLLNNILPFVGLINPDTILRSVVFPQPEGPRRA